MAERWQRVWVPLSAAAVTTLEPLDRIRYFRVAAIIRSITCAALGTALLVWFRDSSIWVMIAVALWMYPSIVVTWLLFRRSGVLAPHVWLRDIVSLGIIAVVVPSSLVPAMMGTLAILAFTCYTVERRSVIVLASVSVVAMWIAAAVAGDDVSLLSAGFYPLAVLAIAVPSQIMAHSLHRALAFNTSIADSLGVAMFESSGVAGQPATMYHLYGPAGRAISHHLTEPEWLDLLHPDDRTVSDEIDAAIAASVDYHVRFRQRRPEGGFRWIDEIGRVQQTGDRVRVQGMTRDITASVDAEQQLTRLDQMADKVDVSISILRLVDADDPTSLTVVWENQMARQMDGGSHVGKRLIDFNRRAFDVDRHRGIGYHMAEVTAGAPTWRVADAHIRLDGIDRLFSLVVSPLPDMHCAVVMQDVTELWSARADLEHLAFVDPLTGLPNRAKFRQTLTDAPLGSSLFVVDLDRFTNVNEAFGHSCGDEMIVEVARVLAEAPEGVVVARLGGDEFGIVAPPGIGYRDDLVARVFHALTRPVNLPNGLTLQTAASMGITTKTKLDTSADELLRQADVALNRAKQFRNTHEIYDSRNDTSAPHRMMLLGELRRALVGGELELHHQPVVATATGNIDAVEGLLVWRHPSLGLLSAGELTEMVELSNLHADIVVHSLREAVRHYQMWQSAGFAMPVSINVNGAAIHDATLVDRLVRIVEEADVPLHALGLELGEQQLMLGRGIGCESLRRLSAAGLRLTIDHFGSGGTAFSLLAPSGAHGVKLDRRAIRELLPLDDALLAALRTGVHRLGLVIAADGADDETTFQWLVDHGVDHVQGAFVGPMMDAAQMLEFLATHPVPVGR